MFEQGSMREWRFYIDDMVGFGGKYSPTRRAWIKLVSSVTISSTMQRGVI